MRLMMLAASLRRDSWNKKLIKNAAELVQAQGIDLDLADFREFMAPWYDQDLQNEQGIPPEILEFIARLKQAQGLVISSPEYNYSTPGTLKNLIDWVSRCEPQPWKKLPVLLMSASVSLVGGNRGLWATRIPLECCGAYVYPEMFSLAAAHQAFDEQAQLLDAALKVRLAQNLADFSAYAAKLQR